MENPLHRPEARPQRPWSAIRFHTDVYAPPDVTIVRAHGEIDMASGVAFRAALTAGLDRQPPLLVVDLHGVSFVDAGGLGILVGAANRAARAGIPITVIGVRPHLYRLFALTRLVDRLDVRPTPAAKTLIPGQARPGAPLAVPAVRISGAPRHPRTGSADRPAGALTS